LRKLRFLLLAVVVCLGCDRGWSDLALRARGICSDALNKSLVMLPKIDRAGFLARCEAAVAPSLKRCAAETTFGTEAATRCIALDGDPVASGLIAEELRKANP
jgi:hypothetical protein